MLRNLDFKLFFFGQFFWQYALFLVQKISANFHSILVLSPEICRILALFFENLKIEVDQLHFVYLPGSIWKVKYYHFFVNQKRPEKGKKWSWTTSIFKFSKNRTKNLQISGLRLKIEWKFRNLKKIKIWWYWINFPKMTIFEENSKNFEICFFYCGPFWGWEKKKKLKSRKTSFF